MLFDFYVQLRIVYLKNFLFFQQCDCDVGYNDIFFHIFGHYMKYSGDYIRVQLTKYVTKYMDAVRVIADEFLKGKRLTWGLSTAH